MENTTGVRITKRDYSFAIAAGTLIGLLLLPVLKTANPAIYSKIALAIVPFFILATPLGLRVAFYIGQKIAIVYQIAKFGLIGLLNTLVDLGVLALITLLFSSYLNIQPETALIGAVSFFSLYKAISFIVANISSYFWNKHWTFDQGVKQQTRGEFIQFFGVSVVGFIINVFISSIVFNLFLGSVTNLNSSQLGLLGAAAGSVMGLAWNFIGYKLWVFKQ